jgi:hypothetical protein
LEPHHTRRVSDGGLDHPSSVAGICPNCHRRVHHGRDGKQYNLALQERLLVIDGPGDFVKEAKGDQQTAGALMKKTG